MALIRIGLTPFEFHSKFRERFLSWLNESINKSTKLFAETALDALHSNFLKKSFESTTHTCKHFLLVIKVKVFS